ncbi:ankyrin repeat domain-containing protein 26-like [Moschus berezovskii]|uniref:ankyrin repeat domain-containing protein 26-like n=1 Tax=Moschus berezovskii TaxID=68408 RepID=UPI0024452891|nr:ankyrin repeat domain-containing protein 26-like [Moschus berezovskii]
MQNEGSDSLRTSFSISYEAGLVVMSSLSDPGVPRKEIGKKNNGNWTQEECVIAPIFGKTDSLPGGLLHVNGESISRKEDREDGRPARKTAYEKKKVSDSGRKAKGLLRRNHRQDEIAMPRLERDTVKNQNQEKEKKCFEDIGIGKGENDYPQKAIKLNKEKITIFQHTGQFNVPIAENTTLNPELENAKQSLETEVESHRSRLAAAMHDHDQGQTSQRDLELASQKAKDKTLRLQDQTKFDMAKLKSNNEMLSQQLSKVKNKFNKLKIKLHQARDDLREKALMLERVQTDLRQAECQKQDIEHMYQNEQGKVNEYLGKQESLEERLSQLQRENMLLRQQLDDARNRADSKEKMVISILDQFQQIVRILQAESEKRDLMLEERNKELVNECDHLKERICQYENEKAEREAVVRNLQQERSDTFEKQSALEASLDVMSRHPAKLEAEARDLKSKLPRPPSQIDHLPAELETACSQCLHLDATHQVLQQELLSVKGRQRKCEELEKENRRLEKEIQAASEENLQQFLEEHIASIRSPMELRCKDLESELSKMKTSQDSDKAELENYKKLYLEELKLRKELESKLDKATERLAEMRTKRELEKQLNRSLFSTLSRRPVLEPPCIGNFSNTVTFNSNLCPRANAGVPLPSNHSMVTYLLKRQRKFLKSLTREVEKDAAGLESEFSRVSSLLSAGRSNLYQDLPVTTSNNRYRF